MNAQKRSEGQPTPFQPLHARKLGRKPGSGRDFPATEEQSERAKREHFWPAFRKEMRAFYEGGWALEDFDQLVRDGCDREFIAHTIGAIRVAHLVYKKQAAHDSGFALPGSGFENLAGLSRKRLKTVIAQMRRLAKAIRPLRASFLASLVPAEHQQVVHYIELQSRLPFDLNDLADIAEKAARLLRLRGRPEYDENVAALVLHIENVTPGKPHDKEVATMIAFATDDPNFNADSLRTWRMEHQDLLRSPTQT